MPDDAALLARLARGDHFALEQLATRYHARLWRYLARQLDPVTTTRASSVTWLTAHTRPSEAVW